MAASYFSSLLRAHSAARQKASPLSLKFFSPFRMLAALLYKSRASSSFAELPPPKNDVIPRVLAVCSLLLAACSISRADCDIVKAARQTRSKSNGNPPQEYVATGATTNSKWTSTAGTFDTPGFASPPRTSTPARPRSHQRPCSPPVAPAHPPTPCPSLCIILAQTT